MTVTNHWGKWVDSESPITGVVSNNTPEWLNEEVYNSIDLDFENYENELKSQLESGQITAEDMQESLENYESMGDSALLIGDWIKGDDGLYDYDPAGDYAAIMRESVTQIIHSKYTKRCALCSPCYPGQGDLDTPGEYLAYDLPPELYGDLESKS